ncbi:MAG: acyltransferase [Polyangia bacterium]
MTPRSRRTMLAVVSESRIRRLGSLALLDNRYPALHGLRVFAIISVVQYHISWIFVGENAISLPRDLLALSISTFFGMDLFFILSGFLIGSILFHSIDVAGKPQVGRFYLRRMFRTFPSYWIVLTVLALTTVLTDQQRAHLPYEYTYLTNFVPLGRKSVVMLWGWSLALEEQFYLVVPGFLFALTRLRSDRGRLALLLGTCSLGTIIRLAVYLHGRPWDELKLHDELYFHTYTRFDTLIVGILLAFVHRRWGKEITLWLQAPLHRALLALPSLTLLWVLWFPSTIYGAHLQLFECFAWGTLTSLMYFPALILLLHTDGPLGRFLGLPIFRYIATLGYGVYLVHIPLIDDLVMPLVHVADKRHVPHILLWLGGTTLAMCASLAVGYVMHVLIEKPSLALRDKLAA